MKTILSIAYFLIAANSFANNNEVIEFEKFSAGKFNLASAYYNISGISHDSLNVIFPEILVSKTITVDQYNQMRIWLKKRNSKLYNYSQIDYSVFPKGLCEIYYSKKQFKDLPALGVNWFQALLFCYYLTANEKNTDVLYRIPFFAEALSLVYIRDNNNKEKITEFLDSDIWTLNELTENIYEHKHRNDLINLFYQHMSNISYANDFTVIKLVFVTFNGKMRIPNAHKLLNYHANKGYANVGFKIVKTSREKDIEFRRLNSDSDFNPEKVFDILKYYKELFGDLARN